MCSRNLFGGEKKTWKPKQTFWRQQDSIIKNVINLLRLKKENQSIKERSTKDILNLFEQEAEDYYKRVRVASFYSDNYIEYESDDHKNKTLSIKG